MHARQDRGKEVELKFLKGGTRDTRAPAVSERQR